jgi:hypothetical protein
MLFRVGIENNNDNRSIAWALEHPGCYAYGQDAGEAQANMPQAAREYASWIGGHGISWADDGLAEVRVEQTFDAYREPLSGGEGRLIESFFQHDADPLDGMDVERALKLLECSRRDLLDSIQGLSAQQLEEKRPGERWGINGILLHVAHAEWWYQERVGAPFPAREEDLPADPLGCLELVRTHCMSLLPKMEGVHHVLDVEGEIWSPRKMLRRAAWHERDHTQHIRKLR